MQGQNKNAPTAEQQPRRTARGQATKAPATEQHRPRVPIERNSKISNAEQQTFKIFLREVVFAPAGEALLVFCIMLLLALSALINSLFLKSTVGWFLPAVLISFGLPCLLFVRARGGKKYVPTFHLSLPRKCHIPTLIFGTLTLVLGTLCLKLVFFDGKYTEFSLYGAFSAHRNGNILRDLYLLLSFCVTVPVLEGAVFRGILLKEHDRRGRLAAVAFSSLLCALLGFCFEKFLPRLFVAVLLCVITYATNSLASGVAIHIIYSVFAVFCEPTLISLKNVSSNFDLFLTIITVLALIFAVMLTSHLSRLYKMYSKTRFGLNSARSVPRERSAWSFITLSLSLPALLSLALFLAATVISAL
ncbi:MAG: lysostaphin resistance A-like protein [Eubacteriales bacterium]